MAQYADLTSSQVLLLATQLTTEADFLRLEILSSERRDILDVSTIYRLLLTFLPTDVDTQSALVTFLRHASQDFSGASELESTVDVSPVIGLSDSDISKRMNGIRFSKIKPTAAVTASGLRAEFLIQWIQHTEAAMGLSAALLQLVDVFAADTTELKDWQHSCFLPLWRLQNDFYPGQADLLDLRTFESLKGLSGVQTLLQFAEASNENAEIGRDLTEVVSPWILGAKSTRRRKTATADSGADWDDVYHWIYNTSGSRFGLAAKAIAEWPGPPKLIDRTTEATGSSVSDPHIRFAQTILAVVINSPVPDGTMDHDLGSLLQSAIDTSLNSNSSSDRQNLLASAVRTHLMSSRLLDISNPITYPSDDVFQLLSTCVMTRQSLKTFRTSSSISSIVEIALFGSEERQKQELGQILAQLPQLLKSDTGWLEVRKQIHQLQSLDNTVSANSRRFHILGQLSSSYIDSEILDTMLAEEQYDNVSYIYLDQDEAHLDRDVVNEHVVAAIFDAYDNASNGNRTRGGMKKASDLVKTFRPKFPKNPVFAEIDHLIKATHSLSFYSLTLQRGILFKPVMIRIHQDPVSLVEKILEQNSKAYTKLDDLLDIGRNLVGAGLAKDRSDYLLPTTSEEMIFNVLHKVTYLAITAALSDHDFDTAYSYVTTRLSINASHASSSPFADDTSWRAAYAAGKYRPSTPAQSVHERITSLSKRMDLLSLALTLAPSTEPLSEILATWRRSEEEMESLRAQALEEERSFGLNVSFGSASALPGGYVPEDRELDLAETKRLHNRRANAGFSPTYGEEAPVGLFDVARGAANALRKSAFPLARGARNETLEHGRRDNTEDVQTSRPSFEDESTAQAAGPQKGRRKRDVVSGMVTGGFVSGMSWVLGAQPVNDNETNVRNRNDD